jgi:hypothetical protein
LLLRLDMETVFMASRSMGLNECVILIKVSGFKF